MLFSRHRLAPRRALGVLAALAVLTTASACAAGDSSTAAPAGTPEGTAAAGAGLTSVATVFPLAWLVAQVAPGAEHTHLATGGQDPHDLELTPGDRAAIETADVLAYMGDLGFQPQVEAAAGSRRGVSVSVAQVAGEVGEDPHLWFDAAVMAEVALAIGEAFAGVDPAGSEEYHRAAGDLHEQLLDLDTELDALLSSCTHRTAIVSHEAYGHLLDPRGLAQEGISDAGGHGEASPQRLAELTRRIADEGVPAVLAEPAEGRADAEALAREAGVDMLEIDPLEYVDDEDFATGYVELLRQQGERFARALECG